MTCLRMLKKNSLDGPLFFPTRVFSIFMLSVFDVVDLQKSNGAFQLCNSICRLINGIFGLTNGINRLINGINAITLIGQLMSLNC